MDLRRLYEFQNVDQTYKFAVSNPLKTAAANAVWEVEIEERFAQFKEELKRLGYTKLSVGTHPKWSHPQGNMVFAEPPMRIAGRVALWQGACDILGGQACGNGHKHYDQAQLSLPPSAFARFAGVHDL